MSTVLNNTNQEAIVEVDQHPECVIYDINCFVRVIYEGTEVTAQVLRQLFGGEIWGYEVGFDNGQVELYELEEIICLSNPQQFK